MERRNFLKRLLGLGAATVAASVPIIAKESEETFTIKDIAEPCSGNKNLWYLKKDCWLDKELKQILGKRVVDRKYFSYYDTKRDMLIPVKDEYTREDFQALLLWAESEYDFNYYCDGTANGGVETGLCRFIINRTGNAYTIDFFRARNPVKQQ